MSDESAAETCVHCGASKNALWANHEGDWLCAQCDHWQGTMACPTCGQPVQRSQMADKEKGD